MTRRHRQHDDGARRAISARDAGLRRISTANRWLITAAVGLSAFFTAVVAMAKPGKAHKQSAAVSASSGSNSGNTQAGASTDSGSVPVPSSANTATGSGDPNAAATDPNAAAASDPNALQQPSQAPIPSQQPVIVSGGS